MIRINLLPSGRKKALILPPAIIYGIIATVVLVIIIAMATFYLNRQISAIKTDIFAKEQRMNKLKEALVEVENYERNNQEFREKTAVIEQLKKNQIVPLRLLDEVSEMLSKGVWLTDLKDKGGVVTIDGYAYSNSDLVSYVQNLKESRYLADIMLVESRQDVIERFSVYKFKLTFRVKV
jgi:Tfp pilus assembly protein PilN